ncbi:ORM1-like protein 2 [Convolutriloba macropyga]|uniref:ORM1-like protein 2 n=1 Tax=Convolutriloba macropyga TaxID=536237 RepID=UPI003F52636C
MDENSDPVVTRGRTTTNGVGMATRSGGRGNTNNNNSPSSALRRNQSIQRFNTLNPNAYWMNSKGAWVTYVCLIIMMHLCLLAMPWFGTDMAWTLTNVIHGVAMYVYFHHVKGLPFDSTNFEPDCSFRLTLWEQLDDGKQYTDTRKFLICVPIVLFIIVSFYTKHEMVFFLVNFIVLMFNLIPKLPYLHKKRLFGINKY